MAVRSRVSRPFRARVSDRRKTVWVASSVFSGTTALAASTSVINQSLTITQGANPSLVGSTIVRTRGMWGITTDQITTSENLACALGFAIVTAQAAAIGITAVPTPTTDQGSDSFYVWDFLMGGMVFGDTTSFNHLIWEHHQFDSKAQRKLTDDQTSVVVLENPFGVGLVFNLIFRQLFMLP